jgi:hypothetical protein
VLTRQYVVAYVVLYCVMQTFCQGGQSTDWTIRCLHPVRERDFFLLQQVPTSSGVYSASFSVSSGFILGKERPGRDVDHLPSSNSEVDNVTALPMFVLVVWSQESYPDMQWKHFSVC